jgi:hypothetical protein
MRTKDEMEAYARGFAESHFYSDEACEVVWQPFEDYPEEWMAGEVDALADAMVRAMLWVQDGEKT